MKHESLMKRVSAWALGAALLAAITAGRAIAFDLTGQWSGRLTCKGIVGAQKRTFTTAPSTLLITESPVLEISADGVFYNGEEFPDPSHPSRGEIAIIRCGTTSSFGEFGGEFGRLRVSVNPAKGSGSLGGMSLRTDVVVASSVYTCRWAYKRVSTQQPVLESCP